MHCRNNVVLMSKNEYANRIMETFRESPLEELKNISIHYVVLAHWVHLCYETSPKLGNRSAISGFLDSDAKILRYLGDLNAIVCCLFVTQQFPIFKFDRSTH